MRRRLYKAFLIASGLFVLVAAPALAYAFRAPVTLSNTSATSYSMFPYIWNQNNSYLVTKGFMGSTGLDSRVETLSGTAKPHMLTTNMTLTAVPSSAGSQTNLYFTTGSSNLSAFDILTGYGGYVTITDSANQELGSNFTKTYTNLYLTGNGNIDVKSGAYSLFKSGTDVTYRSVGSGSTPTVTSNTTSGFTADNFSITVPAVQRGDILLVLVSTVATDTTRTFPNGWTQLFTGLGTNTRLTGHYKITEGTESSINVTLGASVSGAWILYVVRNSIGIEAGSPAASNDPPNVTASWGALNNLFIAAVGANTGVTVAPAGYSVFISPGTIIGAAQKAAAAASDNPGAFTVGAGTERVAETIVFSPKSDVTVSGIADGLYSTATVNSDSTNLWVTVGGSASANTTAVAVPDNANNIVLMSNATPYLGSYVLTVGGTQQVRYEPNEMIIGTNLPDRSSDGTSNNGTFTWGANAANVTATVGALVSTTQTTETPTSSEPPPDYIPPARSADLGSGLEPTVPAALQASIFRPLVTMVSDTTTLNEMQVWRWYGLGFVLICAGAVLVKLKGHLGIASIVAGVAIAVVVVLSIWPWYSLALAAICLLGGIMLERTPSY